MLAAQAKAFPDRPYLVFEDQVLTYAEVERKAFKLACGLQKLGLRPGERLGIILPNVPAFVISLFGAAKAGLILSPISTRRHNNEILQRLRKTRPAALLTFSDPDHYEGRDYLLIAQSLREQVGEIRHLISLEEGVAGTTSWAELVSAGPDGQQLPEASPTDPAAILFTLGSSGQPRGATLSHRGLIFSALSLTERLACTQDDVLLGSVPFSNAFGISPTILASALAGAQLVCQPRFNAGEALQLVDKYAVTILHGVPTMFTLALNHTDFKAEIFESVRSGIMAGAPCPPELVRRVRKEMSCSLLVAYGLTEASPSVTCTQLTDGPVTAVETVGRPHKGVEIKALSPDGKPVPDGAEGELYVRGPNVMLGYWDDPEATSRVLDADGWLKTGDQGIIDPDGPLRISGRLDNVINRGGFKIYPLPIEMWLRAHPGVKDAAVVGMPDLIYGELSVACIVRAPGSSLTKEDLLAYIATSFADYALPNRIVFFEALPRRGSGPVRRNYLSERVRIRGRAWKFGNNIDTDAIIPARRCNTADASELALYCMEDADPGFIQKMNRGDLIVAGNNFGCGSSREVAPLSIKAAGVSGVIARSFARIFFRNAINIGLPILECPQAVDDIRQGDEIEVEPAAGVVRNLSSGEVYQAEPFPDFLQRIIEMGGLLAYVEDRLQGEVQA